MQNAHSLVSSSALWAITAARAANAGRSESGRSRGSGWLPAALPGPGRCVGACQLKHLLHTNALRHPRDPAQSYAARWGQAGWELLQAACAQQVRSLPPAQGAALEPAKRSTCCSLTPCLRSLR